MIIKKVSIVLHFTVHIGITTVVSAISAFLQPGRHHNIQLESSKDFSSLMTRMIRCESEREYEELWKEYNKALMGEPFLPKKLVVNCTVDYTMTPELTHIIREKANELKKCERKMSAENVSRSVMLEEDLSRSFVTCF